MNPIYGELPETVEVDGTAYRVKTDFRDWIKFADVCADFELTAEEKLYFIYDLFEEDAPRDLIKGIHALFGFFAADDLPKTGIQAGQSGQKSAKGKPPVFSYYYDSAYILGAFLKEYGIDLIDAEYMHWYKFRALLDAIPNQSPLKERVAYRTINAAEIQDNKERARIRKIQRELEIPMKANALTDDDIGEILGNL